MPHRAATFISCVIGQSLLFIFVLRKGRTRSGAGELLWGWLAGLAAVAALQCIAETAGGIWEYPDFQHGHISIGRGLRSPTEGDSHLLPTGDGRGFTRKKAGERIFPSLHLRYIPSNLHSVSLWKLQLTPAGLILHNQTDLKISSLLPWAFGAGLMEGNWVITVPCLEQGQISSVFN